MGNGELVLAGVLLALLSGGWAVLAGTNHVTRWWWAAGVLGTLATVALLVAGIRSGALVPSVEPLFSRER